MIRLREATILAYTKLRTRKIRLFVTIFISCLLFSGLASASFVFRGVFHGVENFSSEGFSDRFLISATSSGGGDFQLFGNKELIDRAIVQNKDLIERKKTEAKRLGIEYEPSSDQPPYSEYDGPNGKERTLNGDHPISQQLIKEYRKTHPSPGLPELKAMTDGYDANNFYESRRIGLGGGPSSFALKVLKDGKEDFGQQQNQNGPVAGTASFASEWQVMSGELLEPFILDGAASEVSSDGVLPVVAPYTAVEQLLSLPSLPKSAPSSQKLERIKEIRSKASSINFSVCYRNQTSASAVDQAVQQQQELENNKTNKQYQKPSLIYDVPTEACGAPRLVSDTRTADEKNLANKQTEFKRLFGEPAPDAKIMKFRVIGVAPDPPNFAAFGVTDIFASILTSTIGSGWFTPIEITAKDATVATIFPAEGFTTPGDYTAYAQFASAEQAKRFVDTKNCQPDFSFAMVAPAGGVPPDPFAACTKEGKPFSLTPFGSSSLALIEIKKGFSKFFRTAAIVVAVIAGVIMMGTLGRIIADSRRETAVFRAIGAKQLDIAQIYLTYILILSLLIAAMSVVIGFSLAGFADSRYSQDFTVSALLAYNAQDLSREIHLYAFELKDMLYLVGFTILAGLASAILPLLSNVRRNPIRDMRDEN